MTFDFLNIYSQQNFSLEVLYGYECLYDYLITYYSVIRARHSV